MKASSLKAGNYFLFCNNLCVCTVDCGESKKYMIVNKNSFGTLNGYENVTYVDKNCVTTSVKIGNSIVFY